MNTPSSRKPDPAPPGVNGGRLSANAYRQSGEARNGVPSRKVNPMGATTGIPGLDVIEPDSDEAKDKTWDKWRRERKHHYPDEVMPQDMEPGWESTDVVPLDK